MNKYFSQRTLLELISQGPFLKQVFAVVLRLLAFFIVAAGLMAFAAAWKLITTLEPLGMVGGLVFQLLFVVALVVVFDTIFVRARAIADLPESDFTVIPIVSVLLRLLGEAYFLFGTIMSVATGVFIMLAKRDTGYITRRLTPFLPSIGGENSVLGGLMCMVGGALLSFLFLVICYLLAESCVVLVEIARNTRITREVAERHDKQQGTK